MTSEPLQGLQFLCGEFAGTDHVEPSAWGPGATVRATASARWEQNDRLLVQVHRQTEGDSESFESMTVFMPDPGGGDILLYAFDTYGFPPDPPARGGPVEGKLVFRRHTPRGESLTTYEPTPHGYAWSKHFRPDHDAPWQVVVRGSLDAVTDEGRGGSSATTRNERAT